MAAFMVLAVSCKKDDKPGKGKYGVDGVTPMPEAIDLGIKVNGKTIKWASCNLGASSPEEYGDYYAWGETAPYYSSQSPLTWKNGKSAGYSWASYKWWGGSSSTLTKYNTKESCGVVDNITELQRGEKSGETVDDAARAKLGGKWRIPTDAEWTELRTKCIWTWVTNYNGSGINGRLITATNGNSIFLPAAGYRYDTNLNDAGSYGLYWSSSLNTDGPDYAYAVHFRPGTVYRRSYYRFDGQSVRPVSE